MYNLTKATTPAPSSLAASSTASEATAEDLLAGTWELMDRQDKLSGASAALIGAVKGAGGGSWEARPELTEEALMGWNRDQEDRIEDLTERLDQKQRVLTRLAKEDEEDEVAGSQLHNFLLQEQRAANKQELRTVLEILHSRDQAPPPDLHTLCSFSTSFLSKLHALAKLKDILHSLSSPLYLPST